MVEVTTYSRLEASGVIERLDGSVLVSVVCGPGYDADLLSSLWTGVLLKELVEDKLRFMDENTFVTEAAPILHAIVANEVQVHGVSSIWWIVCSQSVKFRNELNWGSDRRRRC
jgi:hypothetical protein